MRRVSARDLRNHTSDVLRRAESGEPIEITVNRRPVAELRPVTNRPTWISGAAMEEVLTSSLADPALLDDLQPLRGQVIEPR